MPVNSRDTFLKKFPEALLDEAGAIFIGAGVSMAAGYPSWTTLLEEIGEELGVNPRDVHDLAALAQWSIHESGGSRTTIRNVLRDQILVDHPVPPALQVISRFPSRQLWTTNYDRLIERAFDEIRRPIDVISSEASLSLRARPGAARLYKMHGSIERLDDLVISTDDYELFRKKRGAYLPLLQAHLTSMSMLFVGLSLTDPNVRHVLSLIRESFSESPPEHFAIVRPPQDGDYDTLDEFKAKSVQHNLWSKDLRRYGLTVVEIENFADVPDLLSEVERRVARRRIWVSGSWPTSIATQEAPQIYAIAESLGKLIGEMGLSLVSGAGLLVGSATIGGFMDSLRATGGWDLERRLIARPFPQPLIGDPANQQQWAALRGDLARLSGTVIFVGGTKQSGENIILADGVMKEFEIAKAAGSFLLPIASTGGAASKINEELIGSSYPHSGESAIRPTDDELRLLARSDTSTSDIVELIRKILERTLNRKTKNRRYVSKI